MWYVHTIDSSILKRNEVLIIAITWMKLKDAKLQKIRYKRILYAFIYIGVPLNCHIHRENRMVVSRGLSRSRELLFNRYRVSVGWGKSLRDGQWWRQHSKVCMVYTTELYDWKRWNQERTKLTDRVSSMQEGMKLRDRVPSMQEGMKLSDRVPSMQERTMLTGRVEYLACRKL